MSEELRFQIRSLTRLIYFQTDEEDRALLKLKQYCKKFQDRIWVYNATMGFQPVDTIIADWKDKKHPENGGDCKDIHAALMKIYKDEPKSDTNVYVITDPDRWFVDLHTQRRMLNIIHSLHNDINTVKIIIFIGSKRVIPEKLSRYMEVVVDTGLTNDEREEIVSSACKEINLTPPADPHKLFRGLSSWEIEAAIAQSVIHSKDKRGDFEIDESYIMDYRRRILKKTDLLSFVDTSNCSFEQVGGQSRFKEWVERTKSCWTEEGHKFGLVPPKGVLMVGVWGCGKSLGAKAMGHAWGLPVVALEMGKLRNMAQGASEQNMYMALNLIERIAPCVVLLDEGEKSLSGGQSSAMTDGGTGNRMIGIFSTWLQETTAPVTMAITANSLGTMPVEFINRMDERFFFDLPSQEDLKEILKIHLAKLGRDPKQFNIGVLANKAEGLVGREVEQAVKATLRDSFFAGKPDLDEGLLATELERKPRISKTMVDEIQTLIQWVGYDSTADDGIKARYAAPPKRGDSPTDKGGMRMLDQHEAI